MDHVVDNKYVIQLMPYQHNGEYLYQFQHVVVNSEKILLQQIQMQIAKYHTVE